MMGRVKISKYISCISFIMIFILIFCICTKIVDHKGNNNDHEQFQHSLIQGFYSEPSQSLDGVYLGASHVYTFWQAPIGWHKSGLAIYPFSSASQPITSVPFLISEVRKTQPQALIVININQISTSTHKPG